MEDDDDEPCSPQPNYQKLVDPLPDPCQYDIFMGYERWDHNERRRKKRACVRGPKPRSPCDMEKLPPEYCTSPMVDLLVHILPTRVSTCKKR